MTAQPDTIMQFPQSEGYSDFEGHRTWYRITGELNSGLPPVVIVHGGPGCTHDYLDAYALLAQSGRAVIHYDQLGNGRSTHLRDAPVDFWTIELFLRELDALLAHLGIADRYDLLGQSWGGTLAAEHAVRRPPGLNALVIANSPTSLPLWVEEANRLRRDLPLDVQATLSLHEARGDYTHPDYLVASRVFYDRHVCRVTPWPPEVARTFAWVDQDPTVYHSMNGPTEFHVIGTLKDWTILDRLNRIEAPTLVLSGRHDEATPRSVEGYARQIPGAVWEIFENSSHMPHVEEPEACLAAVAKFLTERD